MTSTAATFHLIGADTLLCECAEILLQKGHRITGITSDAERIQRWAQDKKLPVSAEAELDAALRAQPADFLFAITHLKVLPAAALELCRRGAVNFHDGPLPRYAGLNAPAHALLAGETAYGITWHEITTAIDEGRILKQVLFELDARETSLSLNARCFQAAIESFPAFVDELVAGRVQGLAQDRSQRSYFGRHRRPAGGGVLDWTQPAAVLDRTVRALEFGPYPNPLGNARILHQGRVALVRGALVRAGSPAAPGTVLAVEDDALVVACGDQALALCEVQHTDGRPWPIAELSRDLGAAVGGALQCFSAGELEGMQKAAEAAAREEDGWRARLANAAVPALPMLRMTSGAVRPIELPVPVAPAFRARHEAELPAAFAAAFAVLLQRLGDVDAITLACVPATGLAPLAADRLPVTFACEHATRFQELVQRAADELQHGNEKPAFPVDFLMRQPGLRPRGSDALLPYVFAGPGRSTALRHGEKLLLVQDGGGLRLCCDAEALPPPEAALLVRAFAQLLQDLAAHQDRSPLRADLLDAEARLETLLVRNRTEVVVPGGPAHALIEAQAERTPAAVAVFCEGQQLSFAELDQAADRLGRLLQARGVRPGSLVGIHIDRSIDLVVGALAAWKAGAAYVPLDPDYPPDRIRLYLEDARPLVVLTRGHLPPPPVPPGTELIDLDAMRDVLAAQPAGRCRAAVRADDVAYVIYTSGSTGRPKGVQVEHRNVTNFFAGMDARIPAEAGLALLAVTSLSFDISVLEIFWSLARGVQVVVFRERRKEVRAVTSLPERRMDFSLFYFSSDVGEQAGPARYRLLMEGARFADQHGFCAVWTPERHFHTFGGLYPNPAVTGAAVAAITERVQIRAGSVVLPLHNPIRVAEAWQVIDNLSNGRVGLSMASGWQPNDFVLMPENFGKQKQAMFRDIEVVKRLWRGEAVEFTNPAGKQIELRTLPRPVQPELPVWVTTAGNPETYRMAGEIGANLLTHLLGQSIEQLAPKIAIYREARRQAGFDPDAGIVSLMLHTFIGDGDVRSVVRGPLKQYLGTSFDLLKEYAWAFPAFHKPNGVKATDTGADFSGLTDEERDALLEHAFERYFETSGLFGSVDEALPMVDKLKAIGVDEIACLLDYGVPTELALQSLPALDELRRRSNQKPLADVDRWSVPNLIRERGITHLQGTPSLLRMLLADADTRASFAQLRTVMVGGEALSPELVKDLRSATAARLLNMYGPTETTVWSSVYLVRGDEALVPLGEPIANTQLFVLDRRLQPLPDGVPGELCIGGAGVARGYLGRPELTAERFVELRLPEFAQPLRVYRTGDLVRRAPGGSLEFLGRLDHQVKVRGYRIELGEIENVLERQPQVRECVVTARTPAGGEAMLCAYVVPRGEFDEAALRAVLKKELPEFMVPQAFVAMPDLPRTPNQKVDRKALPEPRLPARCAVPAPAEEAPEGLPPELVQQIAAVWQKHLGVERIGPRDNFFDLGGHSLLVVRVHRDLQQNVAPQVSLTDLYRYPTVGALARFLAGGAGTASAQTSSERADRRRAAMARRRG